MTLPADLATAEAALSAREPRVRPARGPGPVSTAIRSAPARPLALGGIEVSGGFRLHGHSDGDVALHAIADALLGAAGLGDLGRTVPGRPRDATWHRQRRADRDVVERVRAAGYRPSSVDLTIVAARPRLADVLDEMREVDRQAPRLSAPTPSTSRRRRETSSGMEGAGRGISAAAIAIAGADPVTVQLHDTLSGETRPLEPLEPGTSASTPAARRSTDRSTSATSGASCTPICSSATCATVACVSPG